MHALTLIVLILAQVAIPSKNVATSIKPADIAFALEVGQLSKLRAGLSLAKVPTDDINAIINMYQGRGISADLRKCAEASPSNLAQRICRSGATSLLRANGSVTSSNFRRNSTVQLAKLQRIDGSRTQSSNSQSLVMINGNVVRAFVDTGLGGSFIVDGATAKKLGLKHISKDAQINSLANDFGGSADLVEADELIIGGRNFGSRVGYSASTPSKKINAEVILGTGLLRDFVAVRVGPTAREFEILDSAPTCNRSLPFTISPFGAHHGIPLSYIPDTSTGLVASLDTGILGDVDAIIQNALGLETLASASKAAYFSIDGVEGLGKPKFLPVARLELMAGGRVHTLNSVTLVRNNSNVSLSINPLSLSNDSAIVLNFSDGEVCI